MSPELFGILLAVTGGLAMGSFFNVVIWRLPRGESLIAPGSHCPSCRVAVRPYDNVPVLSWMLLGGRCRDCDEPISLRYPAIELVTALATTAVALFVHSAGRLVLGELLVLTVVPVAFIDLEHRIIPNAILAPAAVAGVLAGLLTDPSGVAGQLMAGFGAAGFFLVFALAYPRGMGMGDVKLAGVLGLCLGGCVAVAILIALVSGVLVGVGLMARDGVAAGRRQSVPFGPFLALGALAAIFGGHPILHWYLHTLI